MSDNDDKMNGSDIVEQAELAAKEAADKARATTHRVQRKMGRRRDLSLPGVSPAVVGFVRGLLIAAATGALNYLIAQLGGVEGQGAGAVGLISSILVGALRTAEGLLDARLGAPRQARLLGGRPVHRG